MDKLIAAIEELMRQCREEQKQPTYQDLLDLLHKAQEEAPSADLL